MTLSTEECLAAIEAHSARLAEAGRDNLAARVRHCPDWTVADLVQHVTDVHWFWTKIATERPSGPPDTSDRPARVPDEQLVDTFLAGAERMVRELRAADQSARCWTWAPHQQDVAFITRHQVQEAAVHHWDAVDAAGGSLAIAPAVAADAVAEFLTFSVSSDADPAEPERPSLGGRFVLHAVDTDDTWLVGDGDAPGTTRFTTDPDAARDAPRLSATASDLLLWLYGRVDLETAPVPADVVGRFRALCFTD
jgi:uncharacterized protein (TIGR03083 family)